MQATNANLPNVESSAHGAFFIGKLIVANLALVAIVAAAKSRADLWFDEQPNRGLSIYGQACSEGFVVAWFLTQVVTLAIWTALFEGNSAWRLLAGTLLLGLAVFCALAVVQLFPLPADGHWKRSGIYLPRQQEKNFWLTVLQALVLLAATLQAYFVVQTPFWILRRVVRLRIIYDPARLRSAPGNPPLRLLDIFGIMAFLAILMALARANEAQSGAGLVLVVVGLAISVFGVAYLWALFGVRRVFLSIVLAILLSEALAELGVVVYYAVERRATPNDLTRIEAAFHAAQAATLLLALGNGWLVRRAGYRLVWAWSRRKALVSGAAQATGAIVPPGAANLTATAPLPAAKG